LGVTLTELVYLSIDYDYKSNIETGFQNDLIDIPHIKWGDLKKDTPE
jgi:hypothetical protein